MAHVEVPENGAEKKTTSFWNTWFANFQPTLSPSRQVTFPLPELTIVSILTSKVLTILPDGSRFPICEETTSKKATKTPFGWEVNFCKNWVNFFKLLVFLVVCRRLGRNWLKKRKILVLGRQVASRKCDHKLKRPRPKNWFL